MKQELVKVLIIINTVVFVVSLAVIYYRYLNLLPKEEQKFVEPKNVQVQNIEMSSSTELNLSSQPMVGTPKEQIILEEQIKKEASETIKLRKPKFVYFSSKAKKVSLIGDFNDWTEQPMRKVGKNRWEISIEIPEGIYLYNFVVDGKIILDPNNKKPPKLSERGYKSSVLELQ
jgi:hypothetical protein